MIDQRGILLTMVGMLIVTYLPRVLPLWFLSSRSLPPLIIVWLRYVPVAVLAAMLFPTLVLPEGQIDLSASNLFLWAAIPTFLVAWKVKGRNGNASLFSAVLVGMALVAGARAIFGIG